MLVLNMPAFENKKYTAYDRFRGNGPYGDIPTKKEPIRTLGFTSRLPCHIINGDISLLSTKTKWATPTHYLSTFFAFCNVEGVLPEFRTVLAFLVVDHLGNLGKLLGTLSVRLTFVTYDGVRHLAIAHRCSLPKQEKRVQLVMAKSCV